MLVAACTNDTKIIFPHFSASRPAGSERNGWNGSISSISRLLVHSGAQQRFGMTIQVESKQLYSLAKKTSSVFVRQKRNFESHELKRWGSQSQKVHLPRLEPRQSLCKSSIGTYRYLHTCLRKEIHMFEACHDYKTLCT